MASIMCCKTACSREQMCNSVLSPKQVRLVSRFDTKAKKGDVAGSYLGQDPRLLWAEPVIEKFKKELKGLGTMPKKGDFMSAQTSWKNTPMSTRKGLRRAGSGKRRILRKCLLWPRSGPAPATICRRRCRRCSVAPLRCRGRLGRLAFGKKDGRPQPNLRRRTWMTRMTSPPVRRR